MRIDVSFVAVVGSALLVTALNVPKPVHIDDAAYLQFAEQIAADPLHPYGFEAYWYDAPQPAIEILAPPVYLYWLASGVKLAPQSPWVWHLFALPWVLLLGLSLHALARRICGDAPAWVVPVFLFAPVVLPGVNLMLDVPALALALAALALFLKAADDDSLALGLGAGLLLGLAFETKYTAATIAPACVGWWWIVGDRRNWKPLVATGAVAALTVLAIEAAIAWAHGPSHLWLQLTTERDHAVRVPIVVLGHLALAIPAAPLVGFAVAWERSRRLAFVAAAAGSAIAVAAFACAASHVQAAYVVLATAIPFTVVACWRRSPAVLFLVWWLAWELAFAHFVSPFPAMRRGLGAAVPLWLLVSVAWVEGETALRNRMRWVALFRDALACSILAGLVTWWLDFDDARRQRQAVAEAAARIPDGDRVWFAGHWGFGYSAREAGFAPLVPDRSRLARGDWLVLPEEVSKPRLSLPAELDRVATFVVRNRATSPITMLRYYGGALEFAARPHPGLTVSLYRAREDVVVPGR